MKRILLLLIVMITSIGLTGCDLFGGEELPPICGEGYTLEGTECVPIDTTGDVPVINLVGDPDVTVVLGESYTDPGATATDTEDGDISDQIQVTGTVNVDAVGTYVITYNVTDSDGNEAQQVIRTVTVVEPGNNDPEISLQGETSITLQTGDVFTDPGAVASDIEDGDLTSNIVITGSVDTNTSGVYVLTYTITDSDGNTVSVVRTVTVQPSEDEVLANYVVDNWDGTLQFLGLTMANMDFSTGMTMETEINFEATEDIDETHYISAVVTDSFLYGEYDTVKRVIDLDLDGEFNVAVGFIFEEVDGGVYIYMEYRPILDLIQQENPEIVDNLGWVGLDSQWALFKVDDSLQNVVEVEVIKNMLVSLFFSEMGQAFFYDVQEQIVEQAIGFDLNQYGVDLGAFIDLLIEENFTGAQAMLDGVMINDIALHLDYLYLAWRLYQPAMNYTSELTAAGFDVTKLELLNTATWNDVTQSMEVNLPIDQTKGTEAFFNSLTPEELDAFIEIVVKPEIEMATYGFVTHDAYPVWLDEEFINLMTENQQYLTDNWPIDSDPFVFDDQLALVQSLGAGAYWYGLTFEEQDVFYGALDQGNVGWSIWQLDDLFNRPEEFMQSLQKYREIYDIYQIQNDIVNLINSSLTYIDTNYPEFNASSWIADINDRGVIWWYFDLLEDQKSALWLIVAMPEYDAYSSSLGQLSYIASQPWDFQYIYEGNGNELGVNDATWTLVDLILNQSQYLLDNYGIDANNLVAQFDMYEYKAIEWFTFSATQDEINALYDIAELQWDEHYMWTLDTLMNIRMNDWDYNVYFGRQGYMIDLNDLEYQVYQLLFDNTQYLLETYNIDVTLWQNQIAIDGILAWYDQQDQDTKNILDEISNLNNYEYRWAIDILQMRDITPGLFGVSLCNWDYCIDESGVYTDITNLLNSYSDYLIQMGFDVNQLLNDIETYGVSEWYTNRISNELRNTLLQLVMQSQNRYEVLDYLTGLQYKEADFMNFLLMNETWLNEIGFDATQKIADIETLGFSTFLRTSFTSDDIALLFDATVYPFVEGLVNAVNTNEVPEYLTQVVFGNQQILMGLGMIVPMPDINPYAFIDIDQVPINMLQVDYDAFELETVDLEALLQAIYDGPTAYQTYLDSVQTVAPNTVLVLSLLAPTVETLQPYMMFVDDFNYALEGLSLFEPYFTTDYWLNQSGLDLAMEVTPEFNVDTIMTMDPIMYQIVLDDLLGSINTYLLGFTALPFPYDENWECLPEFEYDCESINPSELMAILTQLGNLQVHVVVDPSDPTWMQYNFDFTDFLNVIAKKQYEMILQNPYFEPNEYNDIITGVLNATITTTISQDATIEIPLTEDIDVLNDIAYDLGKFGVAMYARDYLRETMWHYMDNPNELDDLITAVLEGNGTFTISELDYIHKSQAFDNNLSTITVTLDLSDPLNPRPIFNLTLYWVDGSEALNGTVSLDNLLTLFDEDNNLLGAAAYQSMISFVNDENFNLTKLWLMIMLQDNEYDNTKDEMPY